MLLCEREGAVTLAPADRVATTAGRLWCKSFLVLAICLSATALPYSLGSLGALPWPTLGSPPSSPTQLGLPAPQQGTGDDLVTARGVLLGEPAMQQQRRVLVGSVGTPGCFPGLEGDVTHCADAKGWTLGTQTPAPASPSIAQTSPQQQPGARHGEGLRLGTAPAGTLSPVWWLGTEVSATSAQLLQTTGEPSPGSWHHLAPGSLRGTGPGSRDAPQVPAVTPAPRPGQPVGTAEPWSPAGSSEGSPPVRGDTAAWVPAASLARLQPPPLPTATPAPSVGAAWLQVVPTQLVSPGGGHVPSDVPALTVMGTASQSHSMASQPRGDQTPGAPPDPRSMSHGAALQLTVSSKPPAVVTATGLSSWAQAVSVSHQPTAGGVSDTQRGASGAGVTMRSRDGQKEEVRPDLGMGEDHPAAPQLGPLPGVPSALPTEGMSASTEMPPGTVWVPSVVTPKMLWDTRSAGTPLHGEAALLVDAVFAKVLGNASGLLATVLASLPNAVLAHDSSHLQVLAPFLPTAAPGGPAVTSGKPSDAPPPWQWQALPASTEAHPPPAPSLTPSAAGLVTGVSSVAPDATPEPGVTEAPCEDRAAVVCSPSPRAVGVTCGSPLVSPTQRPSLGPDPFLTRASEDRPSVGQHQAMKVAEMSVLPGQLAVAEEAGRSELLPASVGPTAAPAGPLGPTRVSPGSAPPASSENPAPEHRSEPVQHTSTTSLASPSYSLSSTGAVHAAGSPGVTLGAESVSGQSVTSQHPSTAREHLAAASGEAFTPAELVTMGKPGSLGAKPPTSHPAGLPSPVHVLPLRFRLLGIAYSEALSSRASERYRELEEEVRLMLKQMLSTYETFLQANILEFLNGSVVVRGEALFQGDAPAPTNSHLIRTVVTEASKGRSIFSWHLEPQSVQSGGFSLENLEPEKLSISFTVFQLARNRTASLERLIREVTQPLSGLYHVRNFSITQLRNLSGDLEITGDLYLDTIVHADVAGVLQALTALANCSVDLTTLSVEGARLHLQVYPLSFLITNRHFSEDLLNSLTIEHQELTRDLGDVVVRALRDHRSLLQVVIRGFLPGSLICHGDVVFQHPAPTSLEVLEALALSVGPNKTLAGSAFQVDPYSLAVGEDTLEPPLPEMGLPDYGVVIVVVCGLCVITAAIVSLLCLGTKRLGWTDMSVLWDRRDPEVGTQTLEMDNQVFWAYSEQGAEDAHTHWHDYSAC